MNYKQFCQLLSEYYDKELADDICHEFEEKLRENHRCRITYKTFKRTIRYVRATEDKKIPKKTRKKIYRYLKIKIDL